MVIDLDYDVKYAVAEDNLDKTITGYWFFVFIVEFNGFIECVGNVWRSFSIIDWFWIKLF